MRTGDQARHQHAPGDPRRFLNGETRQVWALERASGRPRFLAEGMADRCREVAKREWRCPVPDCLGEITTIGGDRRHHFRHTNGDKHSDGESMAHLAAKAMLAEWARQTVPDGVREEESVKDRAQDVHRVADVMVTWPNARKYAFEVEYKTFTPEAWGAKQNDYDTQSVGCSWLLGHTRVKPVGDPEGEVVRVRLNPLASAIAASGRLVLFINPITRQIGTVASDREFTRRASGHMAEGWIRVDSLEACGLHPEHGIITPSMAQIERATRDREEAERAEREHQRQKQELWKQKQRRREEKIERINAQNKERWEESTWRARAVELWGDRLPKVLEQSGKHARGIHAEPVQWHTMLYLSHVHDQPEGNRFTVQDCLTTLQRDGIKTNWDRREVFKSLINFIEALAGASLITVHRDHRGQVHHFQARGRNLGDRPPASAARTSTQDADAAQPVPTCAGASASGETSNAAVELESSRVSSLDDLRANRLCLEEHREKFKERWKCSPARAHVLELFGHVPEFLTWSGGRHRACFGVAPTHWHAEIYLRSIHPMSDGDVLTVPEALRDLDRAGIRSELSSRVTEEAVDDYLRHLQRFGIVQGDSPGKYFVLGGGG